jgi:hypothetical protein
MYVPEENKDWEFKIDQKTADFIDKMYSKVLSCEEIIEFD